MSRKKGGGFGQWVKNAEKDGQRREHDWHVPNKLFRRVTNEYEDVLRCVEETLLAAHQKDGAIDDRVLLDALKCAAGSGLSIDERANKTAEAVRVALGRYDLPDQARRDILRVLIASVHTHSGLTPGATGYITFVQDFLVDTDEDAEGEDDLWPGDTAPGSPESLALATSLAQMADTLPLEPIPWYQREDWPRLVASAADPETLPESYDAWLAEAAKAVTQKTRDHSVTTIHVDVDEWLRVCDRVGCPRDEKSRRMYAVMTFYALLETLNKNQDWGPEYEEGK